MEAQRNETLSKNICENKQDAMRQQARCYEDEEASRRFISSQ